MGPKPSTHYLVEFAARHSGGKFRTLSAGASLARAEVLLWEVQELRDLGKEVEQKGVRFGNLVGTYEFVAYYSVAFATCLEWHARSRLVDLLIYAPTVIQTGDVKNIASLAISQMVAGGVTVPQLLGAATKVSSIDEYLDVFHRVFDALSFDCDVQRELRQEKSNIEMLGEGSSLYDAIEALFVMRNELVHEIGQNVLAHPYIRGMWSLDDALGFGGAVVACMRAVEKRITSDAPKDFPNRIGDDGFEENEIEKLLAKIADVEKEILEMVAAQNEDVETWKATISASRAAVAAELKCIEDTVLFVPVRYFDFRPRVKESLLGARLNYLLVLKAELE